jgi:hypothetical protein
MRHRPRFLTGFAFALGLVVASTTAYGQDITIAPKLRAGDAFRLQLTRLRQVPAHPEQSGKSTTTVDVDVVAAAADGTTMDWVYGDTAIDNPQIAQDPAVVAASNAVKGLRLRIKLTADGEFVGLVNEDEVVPKLQGALDIMMREFSAKMPESDRKDFAVFLRKILTPKLLLASAVSDAKTYFGLNGVTIKVAETLEVAIEQPSPIGGTLPATFSIKAESATPESAVLATTTTYDDAALRQFTRALAEKAGKSLPEGELTKLPPMQMHDEGRFVFDRTFGLMREVVVKRRAGAGGIERVDGWDFSLLQAPKR